MRGFFTLITDNRIGDIGVCALCEALEINTTLTSMDLSSTSVVSLSVLRDVEGMRNRLVGNSVGTDGACALAEMLRTNTTVKSMNLSGV